jgi:hypothetical protein
LPLDATFLPLTAAGVPENTAPADGASARHAHQEIEEEMKRHYIALKYIYILIPVIIIYEWTKVEKHRQP